MPAPAFDALSADDNGMLIAAGRGPAGFAIALKSGTQTIGETQADENGEWVLTPEVPLAPGSYLFSLEARNAADGATVEGKKAVAFTIAPRARPDLQPQTASATPLAENRPAAQPRKSVTVIKRGDTLWGLARRHFGNAMRYPEIAAANKDQIKNPDLIYPSQQVEIPQK